MTEEKRRVLIIGGSFAGLMAARQLHSRFLVTVVDCKEYFEYTPGILRAYVKPDHFDHLTFTLQPVIERKMGCKFVWGEVTELDGDNMVATVRNMFTKEEEQLAFDYCVVAAGCNFGPFHKWGESLWFPTVHEQARLEGSWPHIDERYLEGRRRHILDEYTKIQGLAERGASVLIVGAGFIGVEWATELQYYFPSLKITIIDFLPKCLGPLPESAANYCENYMKKKGIHCAWGVKYEPNDPQFFTKIGMAGKPDCTYVCVGVKASTYFMPKKTLSKKGPGGGGWINVNKKLMVVQDADDKPEIFAKDAQGFGRVFAVGDCNMVAGLDPIPKISYPGEEQAYITSKSIKMIDDIVYRKKETTLCGTPFKIPNSHWPWGAGMFATSLGAKDACFVIAANHEKNSGYMCVWGKLCAIQKELIETTKVSECKMDLTGRAIWHFVHATPVHLFGKGPWCGY